jgi:hypothetical protein
MRSTEFGTQLNADRTLTVPPGVAQQVSIAQWLILRHAVASGRTRRGLLSWIAVVATVGALMPC